MKIKTLAILAAGAAIAGMSGQAHAAACLSGSYGAATSNGLGATTDVTLNAAKCVGYITGSTIFNSSAPDVTTVKAMLTDLGFDWSSTNFSALYSDPGSKLSGLGGATSVSFTDAPMMFGDTYIGIHWGGQGGGNNAIYKITFTTPTSFLTILGSNPGGSSDAVLFGTQETSVPEPASWALLLGGMGAVGFAMRRRKVEVSFG